MLETTGEEEPAAVSLSSSGEKGERGKSGGRKRKRRKSGVGVVSSEYLVRDPITKVYSEKPVVPRDKFHKECVATFVHVCELFVEKLSKLSQILKLFFYVLIAVLMSQIIFLMFSGS